MDYDTPELKQEMNNVIEFVKNNPYPDYNVIIHKIYNNIELYSEYGRMQHTCAKIIYDNPYNEKLIAKVATRVYNSGGIQSLRALHYIIKYLSPYYQEKNNDARCYPAILNFYFDRCCEEWRA